MKKLAILFIAVATLFLTLPVLLFVSPARAAGEACYNVPDADGRTACLARARGERSMCYSIKRADMRAICLAEVK